MVQEIAESLQHCKGSERRAFLIWKALFGYVKTSIHKMALGTEFETLRQCRIAVWEQYKQYLRNSHNFYSIHHVFKIMLNTKCILFNIIISFHSHGYPWKQPGGVVGSGLTSAWSMGHLGTCTCDKTIVLVTTNHLRRLAGKKIIWKLLLAILSLSILES